MRKEHDCVHGGDHCNRLEAAHRGPYFPLPELHRAWKISHADVASPRVSCVVTETLPRGARRHISEFRPKRHELDMARHGPISLPTMEGKKRRVVIVGGGFGGLEAAKALARTNVEILLVDRVNYHLFQPLLYQVAMAGLSAAEIASP